MLPDLPVQDLDQRFGPLRDGCGRLGQGQVGKFHPACPGVGRAGLGQGAEQVAQGFRLGEQPLRRRHVEMPLNAAQQLHPPQAVQPQILSQGAVQGNVRQRPARMEFAGQRLREGQQCGDGVVWLGVGFCHGCLCGGGFGAALRA